MFAKSMIYLALTIAISAIGHVEACTSYGGACGSSTECCAISGAEVQCQYVYNNGSPSGSFCGVSGCSSKIGDYCDPGFVCCIADWNCVNNQCQES
ncbi:hypothetical protein BST61_g5619 [Cercospora zeina]